MDFDARELGRAVAASMVLLFVLHNWYDRFVTTICGPCERKLAKLEIALAAETKAREKLMVTNARMKERLRKAARGGRRQKETPHIPNGRRSGDSQNDE